MSHALTSRPVMQKQARYENRRLLDVTHDAPCFLRFDGCRSGVNPSVPCHSNQQGHGRGKDYKSHDCYAIPGCPECHYQLDYGAALSREHKQEAFNRGLVDYLLWLWVNGKVAVK